MACLALDPPPIPTLPAPLTLGLGFPIPDFNPKLCCKLLPPEVRAAIKAAQDAIPPLPPLVLNPALVAVINGYISQINAYKLALPFECPFE